MAALNEKQLLQDDDIFKTEEGLVFNPYNSLNKEITLNEVQSILSRYGVPNKVHQMVNEKLRSGRMRV